MGRLLAIAAAVGLSSAWLLFRHGAAESHTVAGNPFQHICIEAKTKWMGPLPFPTHLPPPHPLLFALTCRMCQQLPAVLQQHVGSL